MMVRGAWNQLRACRTFRRGIPVLGRLAGHHRVTVIDDPSPQAFCAGYLRPIVYISRGALDLLSEAELRALLSHEHRHRSSRDPLRFACGRVLSQALFFLPALRPLGDRYEELAEQKADEAAVRASEGERGPLASALLAFDAGIPGGVAGISSERVDSLLGQPPRWRLPMPLIRLRRNVQRSRHPGLAGERRCLGARHVQPPPGVSQPCMRVLALCPRLSSWPRTPGIDA
jgi:hypothetical protein